MVNIVADRDRIQYSVQTDMNAVPEKVSEKNNLITVNKPYPQAVDSDDSQKNGMQVLQQAFAMNMNNRMIYGNIGYFYKNVRSTLRSLFYEVVTEENLKSFNGKTALASIIYSNDGLIENISLTSSNDAEFSDMLNSRIQWSSVPSPFKYNLPYKKLNLNITVVDGDVSIAIEVV